MQRSILLTTLLTMGCATADSVKSLEEEIITLKAKVEILEKAPKATTAKSGNTEVNKEAENAAQAMLKEVQELMGTNNIDGANL